MKKQLKKGLSLFLTVVMLMTCWVWVAPEKASAQSAGNYYIAITAWADGGTAYTEDFNASTDDRDDDASHGGIVVYSKSDNGTGGESKTYFDFKNKMNNSSYTFTGMITGFPYKVEIVHNWGAWTSRVIRVYSISIGYSPDDLKTVFSGNIKLDSSTKVKVCSIATAEGTNEHVHASNDWDNCSISETSFDWPWPAPDHIDGFGGDISVNVPRIDNTTTVVSNGPFTPIVKDQYGVNWKTGANVFFANNANAANDSFGTPDGLELTQSGDSYTLKVDRRVQESLPLTDGTAVKTIYIRAYLSENNSIAQATKKLTLNYPKYNWYFDGVGAAANTPAAQIMLSNGTTSQNDYSAALTYSTKLTPYPTGEVTKEGYTFYGFWTTPQPASNSPYVLEANFKTPISDEDYDVMYAAAKDEHKDDEDGGVAAADAAMAAYCKAGEKWDMKSNPTQNTTDIDHTYYAWYVAKDINIKFYDIDGAFLSEKIVKYDSTNNDIEWPTPKNESFVSGPYEYSNFMGIWENIDGEEIDQTNYNFTHNLVLTPVYETITSTMKYHVIFKNTYGPMAGYAGLGKEVTYREVLTPPTEADVTALPSGVDYDYEFVGWVNWAPATGNYHVMLEDADFDPNGHALNLVEDFTVRSDATYYPVFRRYLRNYDVNFTYRNNIGDLVTTTVNFDYGEAIEAPASVPAIYASNGYEYTLEGWLRNGTAVDLNAETCTGSNGTYVAKYSAGKAVPYNVTFEYKNEDGSPASVTAEVKHGNKITAETVASLAPADSYDNGEALVFFNGKWTTNVDDKTYTTDELTSFSPVSHVTFTAVYENPKPFYTVTYTDGAQTKSFRVVAGDPLPVWLDESTDADGNPISSEHIPTKAANLEGQYTFKGWFDAEEDGNQYVAGVTPVTGNVTLYPQFDFGLFTYTVTFKNWDGTILATDSTLNYGSDLTALKEAAEAAAVKDPDDVYKYSFIGWNKTVPEKCEGQDVEFTAQYKSEYIYYTVNWYNGSEFIASSKYVYGDKIFTPSASITPEPGFAFAGWTYTDAAGVQQDFYRGLTLNKEDITIIGTNADDRHIDVYTKFVTAPVIHTVTVIDGTTDASGNALSYTLTVKDGETVEKLLTDPISGYVDASTHNAFTKWTLDAVDGTDFDVTSAITSDITIYANYVTSAHDYKMSEVTKAPTYPEAELLDGEGNVIVPGTTGLGEKLVWCECSKEGTKKTESIPALVDEVIPGAAAYVGTQKWNTYDEAEAFTDALYAGANKDLIIVTVDNGGHLACAGENCEFCALESMFNPTKKGIGIDKIYAYAASADTAVDPSAVTDAQWGEEVYSWTKIKKSLVEYYGSWEKVPAAYKDYNANITGKVGGMTVDGEAFVDGQQYVVYYKIIDKSGNVGYMRTGVFTYDAVKPVITVTGDCNATGKKYCQEAVVAVAEDNGVTVTVNGEEVTLTDGTYTISAPGSYRIVAVDDAGNRTTANFDVLAAHDTYTRVVEATCTTEGSESLTCYNCGKAIGDVTVIPALGHDLVNKIVDATCTENGYIETTCSRCDLEASRQYYKNGSDGTSDEDLLYPALGHSYTEKVTKEPTCSAEGTKVKTCTRCGNQIVEAIPVDADNHNYYKPVTVKPTCTEAGRRTQQCRYCGIIDVIAQGSDDTLANYNEAYAPKGHTESEDYKVIEKALCYKDGSKTKYCTVCGAYMGDPVAIDKSTVLHTWIVDEDNCVPPTTEQTGILAYKCSVVGCDATYTKEVAKIVTYTVTFHGTVIEDVDGEKTEKEYTKTYTVTDGETLTAEDLAAQAKLNTADGKYRYVFSGWYTKNEDGAYATKYNLPFVVGSDIDLYAKFTQEDIIYTVQFEVPTEYKDGSFSDYEVKKVLMGKLGDTRKPAETPVFASDNYNTFAFVGWQRAGEAVTDKITISGDATYQAVFDVDAIKVDVIFMNGESGLKKVTVVKGGSADYGDTTGIVKASDADNHYTFSGWADKDGNAVDLATAKFAEKTILYAQFAATGHSFEETAKEDATCTKAGSRTLTCTVCKYSKTETIPVKAHTPGEAVIEDGDEVIRCTECNTILSSQKVKCDIRFVNWNGIALYNVQANIGDAVVYGGETPTRDKDAQYEYIFRGWKDQDTGAEYAKDATLPNAAGEKVVYEAVYDTVTRTYTVAFANGSSAFKTYTVPYGSSVIFDGNMADVIVPESDAKVHYVFDGWNKDTSYVTSDMIVQPTFKKVAHTFKTDTSASSATCTEAGGIYTRCTVCGYSYVSDIVPALGHDMEKVVEKSYDATFTSDGRLVQKCKRCGIEVTTVLPKLEYVNFTIIVKYSGGSAIEGARVELYKDGVSTGEVRVTNANGEANFRCESTGRYTIALTNVYGYNDGDEALYRELEIKGGDVISVDIAAKGCSCACHRNGFWGTLFRFFHKIIGMLAGGIKCCKDPDPRYYK